MNYIPVRRIKAKATLINRKQINSGIVSEDLIDIWLEDASKEFGRTSYKTSETAIKINNYKAELPCNLEDIISVCLCTKTFSPSYELPTAHFYIEDCRVTRADTKCNECTYQHPCDNCCSIPEKYQVLNKVTGNIIYEYKIKTELRKYKPSTCSPEDNDTYKIEGNHIHVKARDGILHIVYKEKQYNTDGELVVIDNPKVEQFLLDYVRYKIAEEELFNRMDGQSYRPILNNYQIAEEKMIISKVNAETVLKDWGREKTKNAIKRRRRRFSNYRKIIR